MTTASPAPQPGAAPDLSAADQPSHPDPRPAALVVENVGKAFGPTRVLSDVSLTVAAGSFVTILGPSGCGKTTLLRIVAGLVQPDAGSVAIAGRTVFDRARRIDTPVERRHVGLVFQDYALWPHLTVEQHVLFALELQGIKGDAAQRRTKELVDLVRLSGLEKRAPGQLSGGQQQRVSLARALAAQTGLLLLDEPLSNLDARLRDAMRQEIRNLVTTTGTTAIAVTHDQADALAMSDQIVVMDAGRILQVGTPAEVFETPATATVARFIGSGSLLPCRVEGLAPDGLARYVTDPGGTAFLAKAPPPGDGPLAAVVPPGPHPVPADGVTDRFEGLVRHCHYSGRGWQVELALPGDHLLTLFSPEPAPIGSGWAAWVPPHQIHIVPARQ